MGNKPRQNDTPKAFDIDIRAKVVGDRGQELYKIVSDKMKADNRPSLSNTVVAIILEYAELKKNKRYA